MTSVTKKWANRRLLIVDDEKQFTDFWHTKLEKEGFEIKISSNGQEAIDEMNEVVFDLILLDLKMPVKSGFEVLEEMGSTLNAKVPVYVITCLDQQALDRALQMGAKDGFLKYKMSPDELIKKIKVELKQ